MLELEREAAATTKISTQEALFVILITQHAPFSRKGLLVRAEMKAGNMCWVSEGNRRPSNAGAAN